MNVRSLKNKVTEISYDYFLEAENNLEFALLVFIKMVSPVTNEIPYYEFQKYMLNQRGKSYSKPTIRKYLKRLSDRRVITIEKGEGKKSHKYFINID